MVPRRRSFRFAHSSALFFPKFLASFIAVLVAVVFVAWPCESRTADTLSNTLFAPQEESSLAPCSDLEMVYGLWVLTEVRINGERAYPSWELATPQRELRGSVASNTAIELRRDGVAVAYEGRYKQSAQYEYALQCDGSGLPAGVGKIEIVRGKSPLVLDIEISEAGIRLIEHKIGGCSDVERTYVLESRPRSDAPSWSLLEASSGPARH